MEIKLNVDGNQLSDEVRELLDNLTQEQKQEMALQLLKDSMHDTETRFNKRVGIEQALAEMNASNTVYEFRWGKSGNGYDGNKEQLLSKYKEGQGPGYGRNEWSSADSGNRQRFDRLTNYYSDPLTYFRKDILETMLKIGRERIEETVKDSKKVERAIDEAVAVIESRIPDMVQNAMRQMFVNVLSQSMHNATFAFEGREEQQNLLGQIVERLDRNQIY